MMKIRTIATAASVFLLVGIAAGALFFSGALTSRAVQNPSIALDMDPTGNTYCGGNGLDNLGNPCSPGNSMTVGAIDNCLTSPTADTATHNHVAQLIIQNVEDLVGWQVRLNYIGDRMRVSTFNGAPFTDGTRGSVGFATLPLAGGVHRQFVPGDNIPDAPPDGTNTSQTAVFGGVYNGAQTFPVSPDTPAKAVPDDTSYSTSGGGILGTVTLEVVGNESGNNLFMNLDDNNPNPIESSVVVFNGTGITTIPMPVAQLGDGFHGEGVTCQTANCVTNECPPDPFGPAATATATATPCPQCTPTPTATITPVPTATNTPVATATNTPVPTVTNTPVPTATNTPVPTATNTPVPTATNTPAPCPAATPRPTPTSTPTPPPAPTPTATPPATTTSFVICNETGQPVTDLHLKVNGYEAVSLTNSPGCPAPAQFGNTPSGPRTQLDLVWPTACVDPFETVTVSLSCPPGGFTGCSTPPQLQCFHWTRSGTLLPSANPCQSFSQPMPFATFPNTNTQAANDLHFQASNFGLVSKVLVDDAPGCADFPPPPPGTPTPTPTPSATQDLFWPTACVDPGESVSVAFFSSNCTGVPHPCLSPGVDCFNYTLDGVFLGSPDSCVAETPTPTATNTPVPTATNTPTPTPDLCAPAPPPCVVETLTFTNNNPLAANNLKALMGTDFVFISNRVVGNAPGCPTASISGAPPGHELFLSWTAVCVDPGESVIVEFTSSYGVRVVCADWKVNATSIGPATVNGTEEPTCPQPSPTPCTACTPTPAPTPTTGHDGKVKRIAAAHNVRLSDGTADVEAVSVQVRNDGDHTESFGVYVDIVPPGGITNPYGCTPIGRIVDTVVTLAPGEQTSLTTTQTLNCTDVAGALGQTYTIKAAIDAHANDGGACAVFELQSVACFNALADDDDDDTDNRVVTNAFRVK